MHLSDLEGFLKYHVSAMGVGVKLEMKKWNAPAHEIMVRFT